MNLEEIIVHVDSSIIVINKPSGLRTIPDGYNKNLLDLSSMLKKEFTDIFTVHRLDKETSGLVIFARKKEAHRHLNIQFEKRSIRKSYHALVHNKPDWELYQVSLPLLINGDRKHRTVVNQKGKPSETMLFRLEANIEKNISLLEAKPRTGYTHQIRAHLAYLGFPILGDTLYNYNLSDNQLDINKSMDRMMLNASTIEFIHPETKTEISFRTIIPFSID